MDTGRSISCWLAGSNHETWRGFCDGVGCNIFPWIGASHCLEGEYSQATIIEAFSQITFTYASDSLSARTSCVSRWQRPCSHFLLCSNMNEHDDEVEHLTWYPQYHWAFVEFFKEQSPGSVSSSTHSIWIRGGHAWGMGVNFDELCSRPLFVNPTSNVSCHSGQRCPNPLLNKIFHFFHRCFYYFVLYLYIPMVYWLSSVRVISFRNKQISLCPWI